MPEDKVPESLRSSISHKWVDVGVGDDRSDVRMAELHVDRLGMVGETGEDNFYTTARMNAGKFGGRFSVLFPSIRCEDCKYGHK